MQEVINKIKELYTLLEVKSTNLDKQSNFVSKQKATNEETSRKLDAREKRVSALERIYSNYEEFEAKKNDLNDKYNKFGIEKNVYEDKVKVLAIEKSKFEKEYAEFENMKKVYAKKSENLNKAEVELAQLKKDYQKDALVELIKSKG